MAARRCSDCGYNWPDTRQYFQCPSCEGETCRTGDLPLSDEDANKMAAYYRFEAFLRNEPPGDRQKRQEQAAAALAATDMEFQHLLSVAWTEQEQKHLSDQYFRPVGQEA